MCTLEWLDVMLIDDDYLVLQDLRSLINWEQCGFRIVATATSGEAALSAFRKYRPQLLFCDAYMPGMSGLDLVETILEIDRSVYIFVISSYEDFHFARRAVKAGVIEYVLKNELTSDLLKEKLAQVLRKHRSSQQITARMNRILLSNFFASKKTAEDFLEDTQAESAADMQLSQLIRKSGKYIALFGKLSLLRKPNQGGSLQQTGALLFQRIREQLSENTEVNPLLFYIADAVILRADKKPHDLAETICRCAKQQGENTVAVYSEQAKTLEQFRDLLQSVAEQVCLLRMLSVERAVSLEELRKWRKLPATHRCDPQELLQNKPDVEEFRKIITEQLKQYYDHCDCESIEFLYRSLLNYFERQCGYSQIYPASFQFCGVEDIAEYLSEGYRQLRQHQLSQHSKNYSKTVARAIAFIDKNYDDPDLSVEAIAQHVNKSSGRLSVLFKQETGQTVNDYLTELRIGNAKKLLGGSNLRIYEVAVKVGFRSSQYFSKVFLERTGKRPVDYK